MEKYIGHHAHNKTIASLGGIARKEKQKTLYDANPSYCMQCNIVLQQSKKHNKFCSNSCAAIFNNLRRPSKIPLKSCCYCGKFNIKNNRQKYCSQRCSVEGNRKYKTIEECNLAKQKGRNEVSANYRAKLKGQTPKEVDRNLLKEFYANCPVGHEVDHIIPISKGGLHTLENLQYLTINENRRKSNKLI